MKRWLTQLFRPTRRPIRTRLPQHLLRAAALLLEDRVVPTIALGVDVPHNTDFLITEGQAVTINGKWFDDDLAKTGFFLTTNPAAGTLVASDFNYTFNPPLGVRSGTWNFKYTPVDGVINAGTPPIAMFQITGHNNEGDVSSPTQIQPRIFNAAPVFSVAPVNQVALTGQPMNINLGQFTDAGVNDAVNGSGWQVEIDWDNNGSYDQTQFHQPNTVMTASKTFGGAGVETVKVRVTDKDSGFVESGTFTVTVSDLTPATFVNDDWAAFSSGQVIADVDPTQLGNQSGIYGYDAYSTVSAALLSTSAGGTIIVWDGTYAENPTITKSVSILGPNDGIDGDSLARNPEAVIRSAASASALITVKASNVTLRGLFIDGDAAAVGNPVYSGADANVFYAITNGNTDGGAAVNNLTVQDNIIQRAAIGVFLTGDTDPTGGVISTPSAGNTISENLIQDVGVFDFGYGVTLRENFYANIDNNTMRRVYSGVHTNNHYSNIAPSWSMSGNDIQAYAGGVWHNQSYGLGKALAMTSNVFAPATLNYLGGAATAVANSLGVLITGGPGFAGLTFSLNKVSDFNYGAVVWITEGVTIDGTNSFTNNNVGVYATNNVGFNPITKTVLGLNSYPTSVTLDGALINNAKVQGVRVRGDAGGGTATLTVASATDISGGASATGLALDGPGAKLDGNTLGALEFTGALAYVELANGAHANSIISGAAASFNGVLGANLSTVSSPSGFVVEDGILHAVDRGTSVGFVQTAAGTIFANALSTSGTVATATRNDFTTLANAVDILGLSPSLRTVQHTGTYDFVNVFTSTSWALGQDEMTGTDDDYGIYVPGNINGLTLTSPLLSNAVFQGPGDLTGANLEGLYQFGFAYAYGPGDDNQNLTISNLTVNDFDLAFGMFFSDAGGDAFNNLLFTNNAIRIPADTTLDGNQNIGLHYSFGKNQTISNNTIEIVGTGLSDTINAKSSNSFGMQSNTSGGDVFDGLQITGNIITVTGAQSADPALIRGIWENAHAHLSDITISNNKFLNAGPGNDPMLNRQAAFQITSQSGLSSSVTYSGNIIDGASIGFEWRGASDFSGNQPVLVTGNAITNVKTGVLLQSKGQALISDNSFANSGAMSKLGTGISVAALSSATIDNSTDENAISGFDTGVLVNGTATIAGNAISGNVYGAYVKGSASLTGNRIDGNTFGLRFEGTGSGSFAGSDFDAVIDNNSDVELNTTGIVNVGVNNQFAGDQFYIQNFTNQDYDLTFPGTSFDQADNFDIEDRMIHKVDFNGSGLITWVTNNVYVASGNKIQLGVDAVPNGSSGWTVNVESGTYDEAVQVNESVTIDGSGVAPVVTRTAGSQQALFTVTAAGVTIRDLALEVNRPFATAGIYASDTLGAFNNISILNNTITSLGGTLNFVTPDGNTGSPAIVLISMDANAENVTVQGNTIAAGTGPSLFTRGIWLRQVAGTVGGALPGEGNTILANTQDLLIRFAGAGTTLVRGNNFTGAGMDISEPNPAAGSIDILSNQFIPVSAAFNQSLSVKINYAAGRTVNIDGNNFAGHGNFAIISGASQGVNITNNTFTPAAAAANFTHVLMSTSYPTGGSPTAIPNNSILLQGNQFNNAGTATGRALDFQNGNSAGSGFGAITLGGAGVLANSFAAGLSQFIRLSNTPLPAPLFTPASNPSPAPFAIDLNAEQNKFDTGGGLTLPAAMTVTDKFVLEQKLNHKPDAKVLGVITTTADKFYVPNTQTIQGGIDATPLLGVNWDVIVQAGTYNEDLAMAGSSSDRVGLRLISESGAAATTIAGVVGGPGLGITFGTNQIIDGFTITRQDPADTAGENSIAISNIAGSTGYVIRNNIFTQNRTAIYVTGSGTGTYTRNLITNNRTGILIPESNNGPHVISENVISNNRTFGILFTPVVLVIDPGLTIFNNSITGNFATQLENDSGLAVNASGNWFGSNSLKTYSGNLNSEKLGADLDGNGNPFVWSYPGPLTPPGAPMPYSISGSSLGLTDYTAFLWTGTDTDLVTPGFQGDFSNLGVTAANGQTGPTGRIQEAINLLPGAGTLHVLSGTYAETAGVNATTRAANFELGASPGQVIITGDLTLDADDTLNVELAGAAPGTGYDQLVVTGNTVLGGATLNLSRSFDPVAGTSFTIIDGTGSLTPGFAGIADGATVYVGGLPFTADYTGQDFVLTFNEVATLWVNDNWVVTTDVGPGGLSVGDTVANTGAGDNGLVTGKIFGFDAFATIQSGVNAVQDGGTVNVLAGTYLEDVNLTTGGAGLDLVGEGAGLTTISGPIGGPGSTITSGANNVVVEGFKITREGNNPGDWKNSGLNSSGISLNAGSGSIEIRNNHFYGNRTAIDINNTGATAVNIHNNAIDTNRTGLILRNSTNNVLFQENTVSDNFAVGIVFLDASGGSNVPVQSAVGSKFFNNSFTGNWYGHVVDRQTGGSLPAPGANPKDFQGNWFGTNNPTIVTVNSTEPGYDDQIPVIFGGTAVAPPLQPDLAGTASANIDYSPFLWTGADIAPLVNGFQGDFSNLGATFEGGDFNGGTNYRIGEAIGFNAGSAVIVNVLPGTYSENPTVPRTLQLLGSGKATTIIELLPNGTLGTGYLAPLTVTGTGDVTVSGFTIRGNDAVGFGLANSNIALEATGLGTVNISNNRFEVGNIGAGATFDDGLGIITYYTTTPGNFVAALNVTGNEFAPRNAEAFRAYFINAGVTDFLFDGNTITGNFSATAGTSALNGTISNNIYTGNYNTPGARPGGGFSTFASPDETYGKTAFLNNQISGTRYGIRVNGSNDTTVTGNTIQNTDFGLEVANSVVNAGFDPATVIAAGNTFLTNVYHASYVSANNATAEYTLVNATPNTFDGVSLTGSTTIADLFAISERVLDEVDGGTAYGVVRLRAGNMYVTPNSFFAPATTTANINRAVIGGSNGDTINVQAGSYPNATNLSNATQTARIFGAVTTNSLAGVAGTILDLNGFAFSAGSDNSNTVYDGILTGTGASTLVKQGGGTFSLTANNAAYSGSLDVAAGTVNLTGTLGGDANVSGTLTGNGTLLGDATVNSGGLVNGNGLTADEFLNSGTVSPGDSGIGSLNARSYTQFAGGTLVLNVNGPPVANDTINITTGNVVLDGTLAVNSTGAAIAFFQSIPVINLAGAGTVSGNFIGLVNGAFLAAGANNFQIFYTGGSGNDVTLFTVPAPGLQTLTFADDKWVGYANGTDVSADTGVANSFIGYNSFAAIQPAINQTTPTGTVRVFDGTYTFDSIDTGLNAQIISLVTGANVSVDGPLAAANGGAKVLFNKGSLAVGGAASTVYAGQLTGLTNAAGFVKQGGGTLTISNPANNYSGPTRVTSGVLQAGDNEIIPNGSAVTINGGTLDLDGFWETVGSVSGTLVGTLDLGSGGQIRAGVTNASTTFHGVIIGTGDVVKQGAGVWTLSNDSTFTGSLLIEAGTVQLGNGFTAGSINSGNGITVNEGATLALNRGNGSLASPFSFSNAISGDGRVVHAGPGVTRFTGANSFTGGSVITKGTVVASSNIELSGGSQEVSLQAPGALVIDGSFATGRNFTADTAAGITVTAGNTLQLFGSAITGGTLLGNYEASSAVVLHGTVIGPSATVLANGSTLTNITNLGSVTLESNAALNNFGNMSGAALTVNGAVTADGFTSTGKTTVNGSLTNVGASKLTFGGGSVTEIAVTGLVDVGATGAYIAGGLVKNLGALGNATGGTLADYGSRVQGTGVFQNVSTQNGGVFAPGSSPGAATSGAFPVNGGGIYEFELTNATGTAGALSGWDLVNVVPTIFTPTSAKLDLTATPANKYVVRVATRLNGGGFSTPGAAANFDPNLSYQWKFIDADHPSTTINGPFDPNAFQIDASGFANALNGSFSIQALDGGKNLYVVYTSNSNVASVIVNNGDAQRSRVRTITINFINPVDAATLTGLGAISLTRTTAPYTGTIGTVVQTGATGANGLIQVAPASGMTSSVTLTFDNADASGVTAGVEYTSLADGFWQLALPSQSFTSTVNDPNIRRLFGDTDANGTVDAVDFGDFGNAFSQTLVNSPFDFDNNGFIDGVDLADFGVRYGITLI